MFNSVLIVCVGNLCRSPTGQYLLERGLNRVRVNSAGLLARSNQPACQTAIEVAADNQLDISTHQTQRISTELVMAHDLILVMETEHQKAVEDLVLGALLSIQKTPMYRADALVQLEPKNGGISLSDDIGDLMSSDSEISAEIEIVKSRMVIGKTAENLGLDSKVNPNSMSFVGKVLSDKCFLMKAAALLFMWDRLPHLQVRSFNYIK